MNANARILVAGICCLTIGVGVARFAFTSLLPEMLEDYLSVSQTGVLAALNYAGYLAGALLAIFIHNPNTKITLLRLGLFLAIGSTLVLAVSEHYGLWIIARILAGFGAAMLLVVGSAVVMSRLDMHDRTKAMGIHFSGIGAAILSCDLLSKLGILLELTWRQIWLMQVAYGVILSLIVWRVLRYQPNIAQTKRRLSLDFSIFSPFVIMLILAYFTEGVGFVVQATFLPDIINQILPGAGSITWLFVGVAGVCSCVLLMTLSMHFGSINVIIMALLLQIVGILIPTVSDNLYLNILGGVLYGITFIGLVSLFMHLGGKLSGGNPAVLMGALTAGYGIGQVGAPLFSIKMVAATASYNLALYTTAAIVFTGVLLMLIGKRFYKP